MIRTSKRLLSFALLLCLFAALAAPALADGPFAADQQYKKDEELTAVYAVKVERGTEEKTAALRDLLLEVGFDAYLYQDYSFSVLCGKFRDREEAVAYRDALRETEYGEKAVVVRVYLDEEAIDAFEEAYASGTIAAVIEDTNSGTISAAAGEASGGKSAAPVIRTSSWEPTEGGHVYSVDLSTGQNEEYAAALCAKLVTRSSFC